MLTYTYSQVTLLLEQQKAQNALSSIRDFFQNGESDSHNIDQQGFQKMLDNLIEFDALRHRRHLELYVFPAIQEATHEADSLLAELDFLSSTSIEILTQVKTQLKIAFVQGGAPVRKLCGAIKECCDNLLERLAREENELFPIAWRVISNDRWFQIASQIISHSEGSRRTRPAHSKTPMHEHRLRGAVTQMTF